MKSAGAWVLIILGPIALGLILVIFRLGLVSAMGERGLADAWDALSTIATVTVIGVMLLVVSSWRWSGLHRPKVKR